MGNTVSGALPFFVEKHLKEVYVECLYQASDCGERRKL